MDNSEFYIAAATVIPLLLIAVMATRTLQPGELREQPTSTVLVVGLPVVGEVAAFAFLFFMPVPTAAAIVLAIVTWAALLSQLAVVVWWLAALISHRFQGPSLADPRPPGRVDRAFRDVFDVRPDVRGTAWQRYACPRCGQSMMQPKERCPVHRLPMEPAVGGDLQDPSMQRFLCPRCDRSMMRPKERCSDHRVPMEPII